MPGVTRQNSLPRFERSICASSAEQTTPSKPAAAVMPGKKGKIDVKYNMASGPIRKTITVETNAVNYPDGRIALKIKGEVL